MEHKYLLNYLITTTYRVQRERACLST